MQKSRLIRRFCQVLFFLLSGQWLFMGIFRCPFGVPFVSCHRCPLGDCTGQFLYFPFWGLLVLLTLCFRRAFCGWVCPMGYIQDALRCLRPKKDLFSLSPVIDRRLRWLACVLLCLAVWSAASAIFGPERPYPYVVRSPSAWNLESCWIAMSLGARRYGIRVVLVGIGLVGSLFIARFWCRYLCPLGLVFSGVEKVLPRKPQACGRGCDDCGVCRRGMSHSSDESPV